MKLSKPEHIEKAVGTCFQDHRLNAEKGEMAGKKSADIAREVDVKRKKEQTLKNAREKAGEGEERVVQHTLINDTRKMNAEMGRRGSH